MMTKKDFIDLADTIRNHNEFCEHRKPFDDGHLDTLERFCRERNPNFSPARWVNYIHGGCGPNGGAIRKLPVSSEVETAVENATDVLISRIKSADDNTLTDQFRELTEDIANQDKFSDDLTSVMAERGLVCQEIVRRMRQKGESA